MILVAGGQLDPNIGALLRRILHRGVEFRDLLVGPGLTPTIRMEIPSSTLVLNGEQISPTGCFLRHDVFMPQKTGNSRDYAAALNWFYTVRGWALACAYVRTFNRHSYLSENNKIENLLLALAAGLKVPDSVVTNHFEDFADADNWIRKPVAGGAFTRLLSDIDAGDPSSGASHPSIVQLCMRRPELRVYRIGATILGFELASPHLDYRETHEVDIRLAEVPRDIRQGLTLLCDRLGLDFAAADFMRDDDGELRFLEVNSQPMFAAFDTVADGRISDAIINALLVGGETGRSLAAASRA